MDVAIPRDALHAGLLQVGAAVARDDRVIGGVSVTAAPDGCVTLEAADSTLAVRCRLRAQVLRPGSVFLPHAALTAMVGAFPSSQISLSLEGSDLVLRIDQSTYRLAHIDSARPPSLFDEAEAIPQAVLTKFSDKLAKVQSATAKAGDERSLHFAGVHVTTGYYLATDRYTLAVAWHSDALGDFAETLSPRVLPLLKGADTVYIGRVGDQLAIESGHLSLRVQRLVGDFPTPERVLNRPVIAEIEVPRRPLINALRRLAKVSSDVTLEVVDGHLQLSAVGQSGALFGDERLACRTRGDPPSVRVNSRYLLNAAGAFETEQVTIGLTGALTPLYLIGEDHAHAVMPLQPLSAAKGAG